MKYARILSIGLLATVAFAWSTAAAVENTRELAGYCQSLERGAKDAGRHIYIPRTREALTCWGYMQAMQDLSVLADEEGHRIMGACPPERATTLQLIQSFVRYTRAHRTELQGNAVVAVFRALREAYPCRAVRISWRCFSKARRLPSSAWSIDSASSEDWPVSSASLRITRWRRIWL